MKKLSMKIVDVVQNNIEKISKISPIALLSPRMPPTHVSRKVHV